MVRLVEELHCKSECRGFDSRRGHCVFFWLDLILPVLRSTLNRNEYQEYLLEGKGGLCIGLTTTSPHVPSFLKSWEPQSAGVYWPV